MKGSCSESKAAKWLSQNKWSIEAQHASIAHVEVDFLARDPQGLLHIIEVKSAGALAFGVVSQKQLKRLERAASVLALKEPISLIALVVEASGNVVTFPLY
jgi:Holliday junction resolvase-like predicted endonuclease